MCNQMYLNFQCIKTNILKRANGLNINGIEVVAGMIIKILVYVPTIK